MNETRSRAAASDGAPQSKAAEVVSKRGEEPCAANGSSAEERAAASDGAPKKGTGQ